MNIVELLKERNIVTQLKYYGPNDMATGMEVKIFIENKDNINDYFNNKKLKFKSIDDYIDYLYLLTASKYEEIIPIVREDIREEFKEQIENFKNILSKYNNKDLILYIKNEYKTILTNDYEGTYIKHDVIDQTIGFLCKYFLENNEVIEFLICNFSYKIYDEFDNFKKIFNKSKDYYLYDLLLTEDKINIDIRFRLDKIERVLSSLKTQNEGKYEKKLSIFTDVIQKNNFNPSLENVLSTHNTIKQVMKMLGNLKHKKYYLFENELKKQDKLLDEYLQKYGKSTSFEISIKPFVDVYEDKSKEWFTKALTITHSRDKNSKKLISNLEYAIKYFEKSLLADLISSNTATDKMFTLSTINNISITMMQGKYSINYMINDDQRLNDLIGYIFAGVNSYFSTDDMFYNSKEFETDVNLLFSGMKELKLASTIDKNEFKIKFLIYGIENLICGIIEKVLRNLYYRLTQEEKYTSINSINLGFLLKDSPEVSKVIGHDNACCIEYYLLNRDGVGQNNRNDFAHLNDSIYEKITYDTILEELYLLITLSNVLLIKKTK